jgi:putative transposase
MRNKLLRIYGHGHLHFITFSCYRRQKLLGTARARNLFVQALGEVRNRHQFSLAGYVVMPEHVHLLIGEPKKGNPSKTIQALKQSVSRRLRNKSRRKSALNQLCLGFAVAEIPAHFWQRRFYDFNVWSHEKKKRRSFSTCTAIQ